MQTEKVSKSRGRCELTDQPFARLRCDRNDPCSNCVTRNIPCLYASNVRTRASVQTREESTHLADRLRHLEQLIHTLNAEREAGKAGPSSTTNTSDFSLHSHSRSHERFPPSHTSNETPEKSGSSSEQQLASGSGRVIANSNQMIYVSAAHWAAVRDDVRELPLL